MFVATVAAQVFSNDVDSLLAFYTLYYSCPAIDVSYSIERYLEKEGEWYEIQTGPGCYDEEIQGYVHQDFLEPVERSYRRMVIMLL